jgi:Plavaka transposase
LSEEVREREFDLSKQISRYTTICKKVMDIYGSGCKPSITHIAVANEDNVLILVEEPAAPAVEIQGKNKKCKKLVDLSKEQIAQSDAYKSVPQVVDNQRRFMVNFISFNARRMIIDLLGNTAIFGNPKNLVVNKSNPFLPYKNTSRVADELLDGSWYRDSIERLKQYDRDPLKEAAEFVVPIVMYVDKTGTSTNQRYPLEPFMFTTAIIKRKIRIRPRSWRPLGFIPDLETKSSAEKTYINRRNRGATAQAYHLALEHLLQGMEEV